LVIDDLNSFSSRHGLNILTSTISEAYDSTTNGNPLRRLVCDWHISYNWNPALSEKAWAKMSHEFLGDVILETARLQGAHPHQRVDEVFRNRTLSRPKGFYHQKVEEKSQAS
jgi:hypothetical protein